MPAPKVKIYCAVRQGGIVSLHYDIAGLHRGIVSLQCGIVRLHRDVAALH